MPIPDFDSGGNLPIGVHRASLAEVLARFGVDIPHRQIVSARLERIYRVARATGKLERFIIFGSFITAKPEPNDVDIILIMRDDFREKDYTHDMLPLLNHVRAQQELGASVFWIRPAAIMLESVDEFIASWQATRERGLRGIIEVVVEVSE